MFRRYLSAVIKQTDSFRDLTGYKRLAGTDNSKRFVDYIGKRGFLRPDLMPESSLKQEWFTFFEQLSEDFSDISKKVSAGIYLDEDSFMIKQVDALKDVMGPTS